MMRALRAGMAHGAAAALAACAVLALCAGFASQASGAAQSSGDTPLDRYLAGLETLRIEFTQRLTDSRGRELQASSGRMLVVRPGRFRWEIHPLNGGEESLQLLVADGRNLWFYDRELEQVTVKPVTAALTATPAMLLSGGTDWREAFDVRSGGRAEGLDWVIVRPKRADAEFREARLGFAAGRLARMDLEDKLGQKASLRFENGVRNARIADAEVSFTPPPGVDVIGKPVG